VRRKGKRRALPKTQKGNKMKYYTFEHITIKLTDEQDEKLRQSQKRYIKWNKEKGLPLDQDCKSYIHFLETTIMLALDHEIKKMENEKGE
jgi:hypothetical protein